MFQTYCFSGVYLNIFLKFLRRNTRVFFEGAVKSRFGIKARIKRDAEQIRVFRRRDEFKIKILNLIKRRVVFNGVSFQNITKVLINGVEGKLKNRL
jgi:hypothetical protein